MEFNKEEIAQLEKKILNPSAHIICPRCGSEIVYTEFASATEVRCTTEGCIKMIERGI